MKPWPVPQTKLNSGQVRLRKSAKILALGPHLCTRISLRTMTDLFKKSYCQFANQDEGKFETHFR